MNEDPLVVQMNNLRGYIQAAREANMSDEVSMLSSNFRMLQLELKRQKEGDTVTCNPLSQVLTSFEIEYISKYRPKRHLVSLQILDTLNSFRTFFGEDKFIDCLFYINVNLEG